MSYEEILQKFSKVWVGSVGKGTSGYPVLLMPDEAKVLIDSRLLNTYSCPPLKDINRGTSRDAEIYVFPSSH